MKSMVELAPAALGFLRTTDGRPGLRLVHVELIGNTRHQLLRWDFLRSRRVPVVHRLLNRLLHRRRAIELLVERAELVRAADALARAGGARHRVRVAHLVGQARARGESAQRWRAAERRAPGNA